MKRYIHIIGLVLLAVVLGACGDSADSAIGSFPAPKTDGDIGKLDALPPGPQPGKLTFPEEEAPHNTLTEWWYYTGHLDTDDGHRYGFEYVTFQGLRGDNPPGYAAHFAITDITGNNFAFDQRSAVGANFTPGGMSGFNLAVGDWTMRGLNGSDVLKARFQDGSYALDLTLQDQKGILLQGGTGYFHEGPGSDSYYYSRPRMAATGTLTDKGVAKKVTGIAWFDKQWGNFIPTSGGWDWFSTNFSDNSELMLYTVRTAKGELYTGFGTYLSPDKKTVPFDSTKFTVKATDFWTSPKTGVKYPSGWDVTIIADPDKGLPQMTLHYAPQVKQQELDVRNSTTNIYWEGANSVTGTKGGQPITAQAYVELTGYDQIPAK